MRFTVGLITLAGLLACAQSPSWERLAPLSEARQEVGAAIIAGKIYVVGGFGSSGATLSTAEVYDPSTNRWEDLPPMPIGVNHPATEALEGKLYVLGGYRGPALANPTDAVQIYDPTRRRWNPGPAMPTARGGLTAAVVEGKLYAIGGARGGSVGDMAVFDPQSNQWAILAAMPTQRDHIGAGVIAGKIYVPGGRNSSGFTLRVLEAYDPKSGKWETLPPMPTGRSGHAVVALGNCLYAFGGEVNRAASNGMFDQIERYAAHSNKWSDLGRMPVPRHGISAVALNGKIYLPAGATVAGFGAVVVSDVFTPPACS